MESSSVPVISPMPKEDVPRELRRDLGVSHATAVVVGTIIGSGVFLVPQEMMQAVGSAKVVYLAWIVGGLLSLFGALTYAELGAMKPQAGGEYVYVRDGYGPLGGFLYMWTWFTLAKPASIASVTTGIVRVLGTFHFFHFFSAALMTRPIVITYGQIFAILCTVLISALNYLGIKRAGAFQLVFTVLKVVMILAIVFISFSYAGGSAHNFTSVFTGAKGGISGFVIALVAALWAYDGWNDLNMVAGEIKDPGRTIPIALIAGVFIVAVLYMATNAAVQFALPAASVATSPRPASDAVYLAIGAVGATLVSIGMAISMLVTLNGTAMSGARIPYAAARDGYFFKGLAEVHPRFRTPSTSIVVQALLASILLLLIGKFQALFSLAIFSEWLFYMIAASTLFVFRRRDPALHRPYRTWGYPVVPALFIASSAILLSLTFRENFRSSSIGLLVILAGIPVFKYFQRRKARQEC